MEIEDAIASLAALAQDSRLAIFRLLVPRGSRGLSAGKIADKLGIPANTLSFHLAQLSRAGLVTPTREGRIIRYALHEEGIRNLLAYLTEDCCGDRPELCGLAPRMNSCCPSGKSRKPAQRKMRPGGRTRTEAR